MLEDKEIDQINAVIPKLLDVLIENKMSTPHAALALAGVMRGIFNHGKKSKKSIHEKFADAATIAEYYSFESALKARTETMLSDILNPFKL